MVSEAIRAFRVGPSVPTITLPLTQTVVRRAPMTTLLGVVLVTSLIVALMSTRVLEQRGRSILNRVNIYRMKLE